MIKTRNIRLMTLIVLLFVMLCPTQSRASVIEACHNHAKRECCINHSNYPIIALCSHECVAITTNPSLPQSITPTLRTIQRTNNTLWRTHQYSRISAAIDSTTSATRYGLYNHKILFVSNVRYHYVCRLRRLII